MIYFVILMLIAVVFAVDPSLYMPYPTPKILLCLIVPPIALLVKLLYDFLKYHKTTITLSLSLIECIITAQLVWAVISNTKIISNFNSSDLCFLISLLAITFITRQLLAQTKTNHNPQQLENVLPQSIDESIRLFLRFIWIIGICQALIGLAQYSSIFDFLPIGTKKTPMIGTIGIANGFGSFIALSFMALIVDSLRIQSVRSKLIHLIAGVVLLTTLFLNGSRGAMLSLICSLFVFGFFYIKTEKDRKTFFTNLFLRMTPRIIIASSILIILGSLIYFLYNLNVESSKGRLFVWDVSQRMIEDHPSAGVGLGRFGVEYLNYQSRYFSDVKNISLAYKASNLKQAHNEYFQAFCETGIIGGFLFLSMWLCAIWFLFTSKREDRIITYGMGIVLLVILFHCQVDTVLHVVPIALVAFCVLGFVPVPALYARRIRIKSKLTYYCILILLFLYSGFVIYSATNQYRGRIHWERGYEYAKEHRWTFAIQEYQNALQYIPYEGELLFNLGAALVMNESYSSGIYFLNESERNYNDRNIYLSLSYAYLRIKDLKEAQRQAKIALSMFPDQLAPQLMLGQIFHEQALYEESKNALRKCILRESRIQSEDINQISQDAEEIWKKYYPDETLPGLNQK